ncbi:MAG: hypothetical protein M0019_05725 [Actinomycetota bacterium]|nr:hypothetical protein [Actinomycetota bacterium]
MPGMNFTLSSHPFGNSGMHVYMIVGLFIGAAIVLLTMTYILDDPSQKEGWSTSSTGMTATENRPAPRRLNFLSKSFGVLWIVDGIFQMRDAMPSQFVASIINPSFSLAPYPFKEVESLAQGLWNLAPVKADLGTALIQITIGCGVFFLKTGKAWRAVVKASIIWSAMIFVFGNGFGLFYQGANLATGAPSAILLYTFASAEMLKLSKVEDNASSTRRTGFYLGIFITLGTLLSALPVEKFWTPNGYSQMISTMAESQQPSFISHLLQSGASMVRDQGAYINGAMIIAGVIVALLLALSPARRSTVVITSAFALIIWVFIQDFGVFSPTGTDFNSGLPLLIITISLLFPESSEVKSSYIDGERLIGLQHKLQYDVKL